MTRDAKPTKSRPAENTPALDSLPEDALQALPPAADVIGPPPPRRHGGRGILFAGVAGACVLGAGLGLWARPGMSERRLAFTPPPAPAPAAAGPRGLQVVVDDHPPPVGAPMQTLPTADPARPAPPSANLMALPTFRPASRPIQPPPPLQTASTGAPEARPFASPKLAAMITAAMAAPKLLMTKLEAPKPAPALLARANDDRATAKAAHERAMAARLAQAKAVQLAKAEAAQEAAARKAAREEAAAERFAEAKAAREEAAEVKLAQAKAAQAKAAQIRLAKAEADRAAKADHLAKLAQTRAQSRAQTHTLALAQAKAEKAEAIRLAKAEAKGRAEARAEALAEAREEAQKQIRLASLVRTIKRALPHDPKPQPARTAQLDRKHAKADARREAVMERTSLKGRKAAHAAEAQSHARALAPAPPPPAPRPAGLMKVSARCAQRDPGEALVCADPNLGAAERQLTRAYQGARAAGVPDAQLQRQQQQWLAARSAAAREAPWAVHDVYMARIAELNGLAREAHGDGY
jgi:hypothetical protein